MTKDEALRMALDAFERSVATCFTQYSHQQVMSHPEHFINQAITAIKKALAQPEQEQGEPLKDMSEMNRTVAYCAASKLREIGYEWDGKNWVQQAQKPVGWISNKDFEPIRIRIMQEAYELADNNDPEGYNAIKVMCGDVQKMLSPQRTWVGTVDCIGLALDLEAQAKRVESQTVQRTMLAAANGLRIIDKESKT